MRWRNLRRSSNVRDLRGSRRGMRIPLPIGGRGGLGILAVLVLVAIFGGPEMLNQLLGGGGAGLGSGGTAGEGVDDEAKAFTAAILGSTEDVWGGLFREAGGRYEPPQLTLFAGQVQSACGFATSAVGPFYCPADSRVYLDTAFFDDLARLGGVNARSTGGNA